MGITQSVKRAVQQNPRGRATVFGARTRRWDEFGGARRASRAGLRSMGVQPGDRVAVLALNSDRYLETYAAVPWAGAVVVPLNIRWAAAENIYAINDSGAKVLIVDDTFAALAASIRPELASVRPRLSTWETPPTPAGMTSYEHLIESSATMPDAGRSGEDLAGIFYTGGTTGFPKGVMLSHRSLWACAAANMTMFPVSPGLHLPARCADVSHRGFLHDDGYVLGRSPERDHPRLHRRASPDGDRRAPRDQRAARADDDPHARDASEARENRYVIVEAI